MSFRAHIAIFFGSFGLACVVHHLCEIYSVNKWEWAFIWSASMGTEQLLKFFYLEWGDLIKDTIKAQLVKFVKEK